jgi:hypothetical protein
MGKVYKFSKVELNDIVKMYVNEFQSTNNIAKKYNVDTGVIIKRLRDNKIKIPKGSAYSKKYWLERGMDEDLIDPHIKTLRPVNPEYWFKLGYSESEAILQIEGQKLVSERGCIARYGEIEGKRIWSGREIKRSENGKKGSANLQYWLNKGYSEDEAKIKRSERQSTFSKEICVKKYGEVEGLKIFTERQNKWSKSLTNNGNLKIGYSKISQDLFYKLLKQYKIEDRDKINFATHNKEFKLNKSESEGGIWMHDFTDIKNKKIIEYNGDQYHGNPKKYLAEDYPHPFRKTITAQEMWDKDKRKLDIANKEGFDVLVIWDSEYRWGNKEKVIDKCKKFLKYG